MTTKKTVVIVLGVVVAVGLVVVLIAGVIVGFALYSVGNSEAATTAKAFLSSNEKLKQDIGDVKDFGTIVTGSINVQNSDGDARLNLKVMGTRKTVKATVDLTYRSGREWHVTSASYTNEQGQLIELLNPYESRLLRTPRQWRPSRDPAPMRAAPPDDAARPGNRHWPAGDSAILAA